MEARSNLFTCVNCGSQVQELFKQYSPTVLKLVDCVGMILLPLHANPCEHCSSTGTLSDFVGQYIDSLQVGDSVEKSMTITGQCHQVADKYIEYDPVIVMIDLVLLNEQAYRHVLYNSPFQNHWRLVVVLVLFEAYSRWASHKNIESADKNNTYSFDFFEGEQNFYFECLQTVVGSTMLFLFIYILTWLRWWVLDQPRPQNYSNIILWKALVLSNCGKFLMIPSLIWGEIGTEIHSLFIMGYTFLSQLKVYSVVCNTSKIGAGVTIFFGLVVKCGVCHMISKMKLQ